MISEHGKGPISATELMAELAKDEKFQRRKRRKEADIEERASVFRAAEVPIVEDLVAIGLDVSSVWDLVNTSEPYPDALPTLIYHFEMGGYPDRVMESLGRALAVRQSIVYWDRLKACFLSPRCPGEEIGAAIALTGAATSDQVDDLIEFLKIAERGDNRLFFLRPILKSGGDRGFGIVEELQQDDDLGREAKFLIRRREQSLRRRKK